MAGDLRDAGELADAARAFADAARGAEAADPAVVPRAARAAAQCGRGHCHRQLGQLREAGDALEAALALEPAPPDEINVWAELGLLLSMDAGPDADAAVRVCQQNVQRLMAEQASAAERLGQAVQLKAYG